MTASAHTPQTLDEWLAWQERLHPSSIDLGLDRVRRVWLELAVSDPAPIVVTVGGTNGKGSTIALLESIFLAAGFRVGAYTSPHLLKYNERARLNGVAVDDAMWIAAFVKVERARGSTSLTYFEFGTLAALLIFAESNLDLALLEVGMGGRLDAVNVIDPTISVITSVDIDHTQWLGSDRELIGLEKAGIMRHNRVTVYSELTPPRSVREYAQKVGATLSINGRDYSYRDLGQGTWHWQCGERVRSPLPHPALRGKHQLQNAAAVLLVVDLLQSHLPVTQAQIREGLLNVRLLGRFQMAQTAIPTVVDVAHNPQSAAVLAENLNAWPCSGKTYAIFSALRDKDIVGMAAPLAQRVDEWHVFPLTGPRACNETELFLCLSKIPLRGLVYTHDSLEHARAEISVRATVNDRVVVFGSFYTVAAFLCLVTSESTRHRNDSV